MVAIHEKFGKKVRQLRREADLSQEELAELAKLDLTSINEIENGTRNPSLRTIHKISLALKLSLKDLFSF